MTPWWFYLACLISGAFPTAMWGVTPLNFSWWAFVLPALVLLNAVRMGSQQ